MNFFRRGEDHEGGSSENGGSDNESSEGKRISKRSRRLSKDELESSIRQIIRNDATTLKVLDRQRKRAMINLDIDRNALDKVALLLRSKLFVTVHRRLIHAYGDCFRGSEAVSWLIVNSVVTDAEDAKNVMRHLLYRRIILRVDHTRPLFNSVIRSIVPSIAGWRDRKQLEWYQDSAKKYNMSALYSFNLEAFAKYKLIVRLISAKGLRYTRHNHFTGKWEARKIAPLASVQLGQDTVMTSVEEKTSEPRWDETFNFVLCESGLRQDEVWIRVFDFREVGESFPLGVLCVSRDEIFKQCGVVPGVPPPAHPGDAPGWLAWHPLVPPASLTEPDEVRGGELQIEFQVITNIVAREDETVYDVCRPRADDTDLIAKTAAEDNEGSPIKKGTDLPKTVLKYHHIDRRDTAEILTRPVTPDNSKVDVQDSGSGKKDDKSTGEPVPPTESWNVHLSSVELHDVIDISAGTPVWLEVSARSSKKSAYLTNRRKSAVGRKKKKDMDPDSGVIARKRTPMFMWPGDNRSIVKAGHVAVRVPDDVLKYTKLEFRLLKKKDIGGGTVVGRGKMGLDRIRKCLEEESDDDETDTEVESDAETDDAPVSRRASQSKRAGANGESFVSTVSDDSAEKIPDCDDLPFQKPVEAESPDARIVVLRKQAAFKRNIKIKSGLVYCFAKLRPVAPDDNMFEDDSLSIIADEGETVDIEAALRNVVGAVGEIPSPIAVPPPLANVYIDETVNASVQKLAMMLLSAESKFEAVFASQQKNTERDSPPWKIPEEVANSDDENEDDENEKPASDNEEEKRVKSVPDLPQTTSPPPLRAKSMFAKGSATPEPPASKRPAIERRRSQTEEGSLNVSSSTRSSSSNGKSLQSLAASQLVDSPTVPTRVCKFMLPSTALTKPGICYETQQLEEIAPGGFVLKTSSETPTLPYGDRFFTESQFVVTYLSTNESRIRISGQPCWKAKGPPGFPIKGFVMSGVKNGHQEAYDAKMALLKEWIAPKRVTVQRVSKKKKEKAEEEEVPVRLKTSRLKTAMVILLGVLLFLVVTFLLVTLYVMFLTNTPMTVEGARGVISHAFDYGVSQIKTVAKSGMEVML